MAFEWDSGNIHHIALHEVTPAEAEQVIENQPYEIGSEEPNGELRDVLLGATDAGRILLVAITDRGGLVRVVTAYPAGKRFRQLYAEQKATAHDTDIDDT